MPRALNRIKSSRATSDPETERISDLPTYDEEEVGTWVFWAKDIGPLGLLDTDGKVCRSSQIFSGNIKQARVEFELRAARSGSSCRRIWKTGKMEAKFTDPITGCVETRRFYP